MWGGTCTNEWRWKQQELYTSQEKPGIKSEPEQVCILITLLLRILVRIPIEAITTVMYLI